MVDVDVPFGCFSFTLEDILICEKPLCISMLDVNQLNFGPTEGGLAREEVKDILSPTGSRSYSV